MQQARQDFPTGLSQPEQGYRFSVDALLLGCYPEPRREARALELGTGCGVAALTLLLGNPGLELRAVGIDADSAMLGHARCNAQQLDLTERFTAVHLDVRNIRASSSIEPESFDLVLANPPYRTAKQGRQSRVPAKNQARFEISAGIQEFVSAAAYALKNRSRFVLVHLAEKCFSVSEVLRRQRLEPKRFRFVHGRNDSPARLVLIEALKNGRPGVLVDPPLILYRNDPQSNQLHPDALRFCPFLGRAGSGGEAEPNGQGSVDKGSLNGEL